MNVPGKTIAITVFRQCLCVCLVLAPTTVWADVFKWVDKNGGIHYSDRPSAPYQDLSDKLEAPPCGQECQDNVKNQQQYRQQSQQDRQQSEAKRKVELESAIRSTREQQALYDAQKKQEQLKAEKLSKSERSRVPSSRPRRP
jgi:hypothetical protein